MSVRMCTWKFVWRKEQGEARRRGVFTLSILFNDNVRETACEAKNNGEGESARVQRIAIQHV